MFGRLKQMLIKEFIQVFRDKRMRFILIGPPVIQMMVFGYAATYEIYHVPTAMLDLDHSQESRELVSRFTSSPYFDVQRQLTDSRQIGDLIERGDITVGLEIDAGFAQKLRKGQTAPLQVIVDATNSNTALIASGYISQIALDFAKEYQRDRIYRIAPQLMEVMPSVELAPRPWYNPDLRSRWFFVPGIIGSLTVVLVVTLTAFAVVREREIGTLEQIMVTPIRPVEFILGKTLPFFLIGLADVTLIAVIGSLWFQVPFRGNIAVLALAPVAAAMKRVFGIPYWVACHSIEIWWGTTRWRHAALKNADLILPVSRYTADVVRKMEGIQGSRVKVVYNAIPDSFARLLVAGEGRESSNGCVARVGRDGPMLLSVCALVRGNEFKGVDTVIRALPLVLKAVPDLRYVVVGEGEIRAGLERLAAETGVDVGRQQ